MHGAAACAVEQRGRVAAVDGADRVINVMARLALEYRASLFDLHQRKAQRGANWRLDASVQQRPELFKPIQPIRVVSNDVHRCFLFSSSCEPLKRNSNTLTAA